MYRIKRLMLRLLYKLDALWHVLRGNSVICYMHFDSQHPLWIGPEDQRCLIMGCEFKGKSHSLSLDEFTVDGISGEIWREQADTSYQRIPA